MRRIATCIVMSITLFFSKSALTDEGRSCDIPLAPDFATYLHEVMTSALSDTPWSIKGVSVLSSSARVDLRANGSTCFVQLVPTRCDGERYQMSCTICEGPSGEAIKGIVARVCADTKWPIFVSRKTSDDRTLAGAIIEDNNHISLPCTLGGWVTFLVGLQTVVYVVLVFGLIIITFRRMKSDALIACLVSLFALAVRLFSSPRLPIGSSNGDLTHFAMMYQFETNGFDVLPSVYPPAWRAFVHLVFRLSGSNPEVAMMMTTLAGAICAGVCYLFVKRLTGSQKAGVFSGLALSTWPPAIYFSNGMNLEVPAALFMTLSFVHLLDMVRTGTRTHAIAYALSVLLFMECRVEALAAAPVLLAVHAVIVHAEKAWPVVIRHWLIIVATSFLLLPYLLFITPILIDGGNSDRPIRVVLLGFFAVPTLGMTALYGLRKQGGIEKLWILTVLVAVIAYLVSFDWSLKGDGFIATHVLDTEHPFRQSWVTRVDGRVEPWMRQWRVAPPILIALGLLGLLPYRNSPMVLRAIAPTLVCLPVFGHYLTDFISTGMFPVDGFRHHAMWIGPVGCSIGLGGHALVEIVRGKPAVRVAIISAVIAILMSPLITHWSFMTDTLRNTQQEYLFARPVIANMEDESVVLYADDYGDWLGASGPVSMMTRSHDLIEGLAFLEGKKVRAMALRDFFSNAHATGPVYFYQGAECAARLRSCSEVRKVASNAPIAVARIPNRMLANWVLPLLDNVPEIELAFILLNPDEIEALRERLRP